MTNGIRENYTAILVIDLNLGNGDRTHCGTCKMLQRTRVRGFHRRRSSYRHCMLVLSKDARESAVRTGATRHSDKSPSRWTMNIELLRCEECLAGRSN